MVHLLLQLNFFMIEILNVHLGSKMYLRRYCEYYNTTIYIAHINTRTTD